jgi:hypothetical protein
MSDNGVAAPGQGYARTNMTVVVDVDDHPSVDHSSASNASTLIDLGVSVEWHLDLTLFFNLGKLGSYPVSPL